jgi:general secretion pathway protein K
MLICRNRALSSSRLGTASNARKGGALLAVLWLSAALAAIAFSVATSIRAETDRVFTSAEGLRAYYLATGAVDRAIQWMMWGPTYRNPDGSPRFWQPNMPRMYMSFPSGDAVVELIPESSKLNINTASPDDLLRVVATVTGDAVTGNLARSSEIVAAIVDWRSPAAAPSPFDPFYFSIAPTFRARHASFEEIEELLLVRGMTPEVFYGNYIPNPNGDPNARLLATGGLRDCLSVWGSVGPFDINTASPALMEAMGVPPPGVDAIVARRTAQPFLNMADVGALGFPTPRMTIGGNWIWTFRASARLRHPDGSPSEVARTAAAVVKLVDRERFFIAPVHILRWYDDAWSQAALPAPAAQPVSLNGAPSGALLNNGAPNGALLNNGAPLSGVLPQ